MDGKQQGKRRRHLDLTLTTYVTPGPEIFSLECSHPREGLFTSPPQPAAPVPPRPQPSPLGWDSSILPFFPELAEPGSSGAWGAPEAAGRADEPGLPDPPPVAPPWSLDTAGPWRRTAIPWCPAVRRSWRIWGWRLCWWGCTRCRTLRQGRAARPRLAGRTEGRPRAATAGRPRPWHSWRDHAEAHRRMSLTHSGIGCI